MKTLSLRQQSTLTKKDFSKIRILLRLLVLGTVIMLFSLFYIWSRVQVVQIGYDIGELQRQQKDLKVENQKLKMEISVLKSPERIEKLAIEKLNMIWPTPDQVYELKP